MLPLNLLTFLLILASFLVFMMGMKAVFFDPVGRIKVLREQKIKLDNISAQELQQELDTLEARIQHQMTESRLKAQTLLNEAQASAKSNASQLVGEARQAAEQARDTLKQQLDADYQDVLRDLQPSKTEMVALLIQRLNKQPQLVGGSM
jgi:F0F1-type ATP synthase membrane subunit b/b'